MKLKPTVLLATFVVTAGLLLGASAAQAATVITDGDGNVTRITNLPVLVESLDAIINYNVDFVYNTAINVYSSGEFDFFPAEDAVVALIAVNEALNAEDPTPPGAGPQGSDQFFIGAIEYFGRVLAVGGQNISGVWGDCEQGSESECIAGTAVLDPADPFTYAKFTETQDVPPGPATLISPGGTITENNPTYTWNAVADSTWYRLWVNDPSGDKIIDDWYTATAANCGEGTGECSVTPVEVLADGTHKWWIQTYNEFGDGPWSAAKSFTVDTTGATPEPATLISPSGTITDTNTPTYTWNAVANATEYRLTVKEDGTNRYWIDEKFTADQANCGAGTGECSVTPETVLVDGPYLWRIQTRNASGAGPGYAELSFTMDTGTSVPPGKAELISPRDTIVDNTPTYTWNAVETATWYLLYVQEERTRDVIIEEWYTAEEANCGDGTGECSVTPETVLADRSHKWWIRAWNDFGNAPWSAWLNFTVDAGTTGLNVILDDFGNVTRIEKMKVFDETSEDPTIYDVDFIYGTVTDVYGSGLDFDFSAPENDENIFIALEAVTDALNGSDPIPVGAGPQGSDQFFIGHKEEDGLIVAVGGEPLAGVWGRCFTDPCLDFGEIQTGVAVLSPNDPFTWADFTVAD